MIGVSYMADVSEASKDDCDDEFQRAMRISVVSNGENIYCDCGSTRK